MLAHLLTVDVEDWSQSTLDRSIPIGDRVVANTQALLELMAETQVQGTFFVLGKVAEAHPGLARDIAVAGHELGTHGYSHESIESMPVARFKDELHRSVDVLRQQTGCMVLGHRAADFSISERSLKLLDCLADEGIGYDSSIFPVRHPRYGVAGAWRQPHLVQCLSGRTLIEFPLATMRIVGFNLPGAGGGYLRIFPYWWSRHTVRRLEREGIPATCYVHPYELDTAEMEEIPYPVPRLLRWSQSANRRSVRRKLLRLFSDFHFVPMGEAYEGLRNKDLEVGLDLRANPKPTYRPQPLRNGSTMRLEHNPGNEG